MFDWLFGENPQYNLLKQQNFVSSYQLTTKSCFVMGKDNPPIHVSSSAVVDLKQTVEKKKIWTKVSFVDMTTETDNNNLKESLQETQLFTKINPVIEVQRNENGKVKNICNMPEIWKDWEHWKKTQLPILIPDEHKQQKIINNYETGLTSLEQNFEKNFQYLLLLPECYKFRSYAEPLDVSSTKTYSSRFVEKLDIFYKLRKKSFSDKDNIVKLILNSQSNIEEEQMKKQLTAFYESHMPDFSGRDYLFDIRAEYALDKTTSKIIDAKLFFVEKLHPNFNYTIELELIRIDREQSIRNKPSIVSEDKKDISVSPESRKCTSKWSTLMDDDDDSFVIG